MRFEIGPMTIMRANEMDSLKDELPFNRIENKLRAINLPSNYALLKNVIYDYNYNPEIIIDGFSLEAAEKRLAEMRTLVDSDLFDILQRNGTYSIAMPASCEAFLTSDEKQRINCGILRSSVFVPYVYRFFKSEKHVKTFFNEGLLLISSIERCRKLDEKNRADIYESRNLYHISDGEREVQADIAAGLDNLLLCTSLSRQNYDENHNKYQYGFRINDVQGFIRELTLVLVSSGLNVKSVWHGPCIYDNKIFIKRNSIIITKFIDSLLENKFNADLLCEAILQEGGNKIFFNKPISYDVDNEYRFVWTLGNKSIELDSSRIEKLEDGALIIKAPELVQYCEEI